MQRRTNIFSEAIRKLRRSTRRFSRGGGLKKLFSQFKDGLKRRDVRYIGASAGILIVVAVVVTLFITLLPPMPTASSAQIGAQADSLASAANVSVAVTPTPGALLITPPPTPTPSATPVPTPTPMGINKGYEGPEVSEIQLRLMDLGYMDYDEPTTLYGPMTKNAVELFQKRNGLSVDGVVGQTTYDALMSDAALIYMVSEGAEGDDVQALQVRLRELGYIETATGYFGTDTTAAVTKFQQNNRLDVDGMIGPETKEMLYSEDAVANAVSYGENSEVVKKFQQRLFKLGYLTTEPDGNFGHDTVAAVKLFQELNGLIADGYVGPQTRDLLMSSDAQPNAMTLGMRGDTVERVQNRLKKLGYLASVTGYYGSDTESAVRAFQTRNSLSSDGKVGKNTMTVLFSDSAKKATSTPVSSGGDTPTATSSPVYTSDGASVDRLIEIAMSRLGSRYVSGGKGPNTFDCSGFVYYCLNQAGIRQGYMTSKTWRSVSKYQEVSSLSNLRRGDIIVFKMGRSSGHVAIALGDGTMIHAGSTLGKVYISSYNTDYWKKTFYTAYRIF